MDCYDCMRTCDKHSFGSVSHFDISNKLSSRLQHLKASVLDYLTRHPEEEENLLRAVNEVDALCYFLSQHRSNLLVAASCLLDEHDEWRATLDQKPN